MRSPKKSIATIIIITLVATITILGAVSGYIYYIYERHQQFTLLNNELILTTNQLAESLALPLWDDDKQQIGRILETLLLNTNIYGVEVNTPEKIYARLRDPQKGIIARDQELKANELFMEERGLFFENESIGNVKVFATPKFIEENLKTTLIAIIGVILFVDLILVLSLYLLLWYIMLKPLRAIEKFAEAVSSGKEKEMSNHDTRFHGELFYLRESMGKMVKLLNSRYAKIKESEEELKNSQEFLSNIVENIPAMMFVKDATDFRFMKLNRAGEKLLGYSREEILGKNVYDFCPKHEADFFTIKDSEVIKKGRLVEIAEETVQTRYMGERLLNTKKIPIFDKQGNPQYLLGISEDITERKKAEDALMAEKERLAVTLRSIGDGVITTDVDGKITLMNKVAEKLTGWLLKDALGRPLAEVFNIINERTRLGCENPAHKVLKTGKMIELENHTVLVNLDGTERIIADSGAPILDRNSNTIGFVLVFRDMTEKQKIESALQNALKLESLNILAGGIAHDFNNLLGGIFGYIDLALGAAMEENLEKTKSKISDALTVFDRAKDLTQQLLTFAKGGDPKRKIGSIVKLVRDSVQFVLTGSSISISFDIPDYPFLCDFDMNQIGQVIDNIAINARQAMSLGGKIEVKISITPPHEAPPLLPKVNYVKISIKDNGPGISKENLLHIFDPFFTTKKHGSGLGLATCYSIIKRHDGIIEVETEKNKGTTFHIYIPEASGLAETPETEIPKLYKGQGRILVMDDQETLIDVTSSMLEALGYNVESAANGDEAIKLVTQSVIENKPFVAVILDLTIPGGRGGKDVVNEIINIDPSIKAIASSGYSGDSVMSDPAAFGFSACLIKPFRMNDLIRAIESLSIGFDL